VAIDPLEPDTAESIRILAWKTARERGFTKSDVPDIEQHLRMHLIKNNKKLHARSANQKTVIDVALRNAILNLIEARVAKRRDERPNIHIDDAPTTTLARHDDALRQRTLSMDMQNAVALLPADIQATALYLMEHSPAEAQRQFNLTRGKLRHQMKLIADRFMECGLTLNDDQPNDVSCLEDERSHHGK